MNPWHDISPGENIPEEVNVVIEVSKGSVQKYELDKETGLLILDRVLYSAVHYPGDYGFIPRTYWDDNDPLDVIIISNFPTEPRTLVKVRPIGAFEMIDSGEKDDKIIAVHSTDPRMDRFKSIKDVPEHILREIKHFFETYKELEGKKVRIVGFKDVDEAKKIILRGIDLYSKKFKK